MTYTKIAVRKAQTRGPAYRMAKTIGGSVVKNEEGAVLASFSNDPEAERLLGRLIGAIAEIAGGSVFDETRNEYRVGTLDQLLG